MSSAQGTSPKPQDPFPLLMLVGFYVSDRRTPNLYLSGNKAWSPESTIFHNTNTNIKDFSTTHILSVPPPYTYTQLLASLKSVYLSRQELSNTRWVCRLEEVGVKRVKVCWEGTMASGEENFTIISEKDGGCETVLGMVRDRGCRDVLRVYYEPTR